MKRKAKIYYIELDDFWRKEEKLAWLRDNPLSSIKFETISPDEKHNWINQTDNDFESLMPLIDKDVKFGKSDEAVFRLFSLGSVTNRDEWVYDFNKIDLEAKLNHFIEAYERKRKALFSLKEPERKALVSSDKDFNEFIGSEIKFTRELIQRDFLKNKEIQFNESKIIQNAFRPFIKKFNYFDSEHRITHEPYQMPQIFGKFGEQENKIIAFNVNSKDFKILATNCVCDLHFIGDSQTLPFYRYDSENHKHENITDWALNQFRKHYGTKAETRPLGSVSNDETQEDTLANARVSALNENARITKQDIFYYVYGVLHCPQYRRKYEQNLKREFPRIPFYEDFFQWRDWGAELMDLHLNYETQKPYQLTRMNSYIVRHSDDDSFYSKPRTILRADKPNRQIIIDSLTRLTCVPSIAWEYKLGNRSAIEWVLDQYKERKPKDATIRERFNTYKFADYKEQVIDLIRKVTTVSIKTMEIVEKMPNE